MPPPRRARRGRRRRRSGSAVEEAGCAGERGWLAVRRRVFKRDGRGGGGEEHGDDEGLPFGDETLLLIFSGLVDTRDLVKCAATCRRWRRLVSSDAAFICCRAPPRCDRFVRRLALGFFLQGGGGVAGGSPPPPRFVPFVSPLRQQLSLDAIVGGGLLESSRMVASRNGRVVLDLRRTKSGCVLRLCVCDPMTGVADFLPPLRGKDSPGPYACTVLTAADGLHLYGGDDRRCAGTSASSSSSSSSYRVLVVYNRRGFTAVRCYSSDSPGSWGPEAAVAGAKIGRKRQLGNRAAHASIVRGGVVCWPGLAVALQLPTLQTSTPPYTVQGFHAPGRHDGKATTSTNPAAVDRHLLGVMPDGRLCVVESDPGTIRAYVVAQPDVVRYGGASRKKWLWTLKVAALVGPQEHAVRLRWFCEKSGVMLFTTRRERDGCGEPRTCVYAVDVETMQVGRVAGGEWSGDGDVCGYEMDRVAMLADLHI